MDVECVYWLLVPCLAELDPGLGQNGRFGATDEMPATSRITCRVEDSGFTKRYVIHVCRMTLQDARAGTLTAPAQRTALQSYRNSVALPRKM